MSFQLLVVAPAPATTPTAMAIVITIGISVQCVLILGPGLVVEPGPMVTYPKEMPD